MVEAEKFDPLIHLADTVTGKELRTLDGHADGRWPGLSFSHDGKTLASAGNGGVRLWDVAAGKELHDLKGNGSLAFSPDGRWLATNGIRDDNSIHLWEVATGKEIRSWISRYDLFRYFPLVFSADGKLLASIGHK